LFNNFNARIYQQILYYFPNPGIENFKTFKYSGGNDSITYSLIWSPLADWLLKFVPPSIAPNSITLSSLILLSITHILFVFAGSNENGVAVWKSILMAITIFIYQNLDNLDGKQARKTSKITDS
jgi:ethanolaminephosphotransferase